MNVQLVYFSPTGTTKAVVTRIVDGIRPDSVQVRDITLPEARSHPLRTSQDDLLVIGVPVYMGRVPALLTDWLESLKASRTRVVCVVVYGNRTYEDALLELSDMVSRQGGITIAGGAFIGEHSFSEPEAPTAHGRPDADDVSLAEAFGRAIREKLQTDNSRQEAVPKIPGERPYRGITQLWDVDFIEVSDPCEQCGACASVCPVAAIAPDDSRDIDLHRCITCCACIKSCPNEARSMKPGPVKDAQTRLTTLFSEPKKPEWFL